MNYPNHVWIKAFKRELKPWSQPGCDLEVSDMPLDGWVKYMRVNEPETPPGLKLSRVEMMDGKPVRCFVEDK